MATPPSFLTRDARILDLIRKGDEEALVMLFRDTRAVVTDFILRNSGSVDDAEDLLQDALIILWERVRSGRFEYAAKLSTFVLGVVKNKWLRVLSVRKREPPLNDTAEPEADDEPLDETTIRKEEVALVHQAMGQLDQQCRRLLLLFYWEDRSMEEIADIMNFANAATAKSKKYQCKKSLEALLKSLMGR